ncbi:hypothetical protein ACLOJK_002006 [Asimina triloba]
MKKENDDDDDVWVLEEELVRIDCIVGIGWPGLFYPLIFGGCPSYCVRGTTYIPRPRLMNSDLGPLQLKIGSLHLLFTYRWAGRIADSVLKTGQKADWDSGYGILCPVLPYTRQTNATSMPGRFAYLQLAGERRRTCSHSLRIILHMGRAGRPSLHQSPPIGHRYIEEWEGPGVRVETVPNAATKDIMFITIIDDIYDVYGSLDELKLFTNAIDRWDLGAIDQLPDYMKLCYLALYNTTNELAYITLKETGRNLLDYLKKLLATQCNTYLVEAQWFYKDYTPTLEEYLNNASVSIGCSLVLAHAYAFILQQLTKEDIDDRDKYLKLIALTSLIFRLFDDLSTSEAELRRGDVSKSIQCYMNEANVSEEIARERIRDMISDAWKELNEESLKSSSLRRSFVNAIINGARAGAATYHHGDGFGHPDHEVKGQALSLFFEPLALKGPNNMFQE